MATRKITSPRARKSRITPRQKYLPRVKLDRASSLIGAALAAAYPSSFTKHCNALDTLPAYDRVFHAAGLLRGFNVHEDIGAYHERTTRLYQRAVFRFSRSAYLSFRRRVGRLPHSIIDYYHMFDAAGMLDV